MKNTGWKDIAELIGIAAIVASLVFVGLELRQSQKIAIVESAVNRTTQHVDLDNAIIEHIDIWTKGNSGTELTPKEAGIYSMLFENYVGQQWLRWFSNSQLGFVTETAVADLAAYLVENPGAMKEYRQFRARVDRRRGMLIPGFADPFALEVAKLLEEYDSQTN